MDQKPIKVSVYQNAKDNQGKIVDLLRWLEGYEPYNKLIDQIRQEPDKEKRDELKKKLPAITPAGTFSTRNDESLISHSGFIALDFDHLPDPENVKDYMGRLDFVFYCGLSASGAGVWALIPLAYPDQHQRHYLALEADFIEIGLTPDPKCKNLSRLRFYSYDQNPVFNIDAVKYERLALITEPETYTPDPAYKDNGSALDYLINKIERTQTDITANYEDWLKIGGTLAAMFGENGREKFHRISRYYPGYDRRKTDDQFNTCLKHRPNYSERMIFSIARKNNLLLKG